MNYGSYQYYQSENGYGNLSYQEYYSAFGWGEYNSLYCSLS